MLKNGSILQIIHGIKTTLDLFYHQIDNLTETKGHCKQVNNDVM